MRYPLAALFVALGCAADPVLLPDAGPCNGSCGAGTVCVAGACVSVDGGAVDVGGTDAGGGVDVQQQVMDTGRVDVGSDAGAMPDVPSPADVGADVPADTYGACIENGIRECDGRNVMTQLGEVDGGRTYHCGGCGITCAVGEVCHRCLCQR